MFKIRSLLKDSLSSTFALFAVVGLTIAASPADARDEVKVNIMISPEGSGPYNAFAVMQTRAKDNHPWLRPIAVETPGFNYNVSFISKSPDKWKNTIFGSGSVVEWAAANGLAPFYKKPLEEVENYKIIGIMGITGNVFVTFDDAIQSPNDFVGKNVVTGLLTQNEWGMHHRMLLDGWGLTKKLKSYSALGPRANVQAVIDGRADIGALVLFSPSSFDKVITPGPFKTVAATKRKFHFVDIPEKMIMDYNKKTGAIFEVRKYKAGMIPGQTKAFTTFGDRLLLSAHKDFPEELAYEFAKLWVKMAPIVAKVNAMGRMWDGKTLASAVEGMKDRLHPGALRAYKELGLVK